MRINRLFSALAVAAIGAATLTALPTQAQLSIPVARDR